MTRDEILKMAREVGLTFDPRWGMCTTGNVQIERLVHAAYEAGAAAERKACAELCASNDSRAGEWLPETRVGIYFAELIRMTRDAK